MVRISCSTVSGSSGSSGGLPLRFVALVDGAEEIVSSTPNWVMEINRLDKRIALFARNAKGDGEPYVMEDELPQSGLAKSTGKWRQFF